MKRFVLLLLLCWYSGNSAASAATKEYIVETSHINNLVDQLNVEVQDANETRSLYLVTYDGPLDSLQSHPSVSVAEENKRVQLPVSQYNDAFAAQTTEDWGYSFLRLTHLIYGPRSVKIALLDTGTDYKHPALIPYLEPGFTMFANGTAQDEHGHGTAIAGVIANGSQLNMRILPIKVLNARGIGSVYTISSGIYRAIEEQVDIINTSLGSVVNSEVLETAVKEARKNDIQIISAVGNYGGSGALYPARYPSVYGVGSIDKSGSVAEFSHHGEGLDFVAPGVKVRTTKLGGGYTTESGTSLSAGYLTKMLGAVLSQETVDNASVRSVLLKSASIQPADRLDSYLGYGYIDVLKLNYQNMLGKLQSPDWVESKELLITDSRKSWTVTFSEPVDVETINSRTVLLTGDEKVLPVQTESTGNRIVVTPLLPYEPDTLYRLYIINPIRSLQGQELQRSVIQPFSYTGE